MAPSGACLSSEASKPSSLQEAGLQTRRVRMGLGTPSFPRGRDEEPPPACLAASHEGPANGADPTRGWGQRCTKGWAAPRSRTRGQR